MQVLPMMNLEASSRSIKLCGVRRLQRGPHPSHALRRGGVSRRVMMHSLTCHTTIARMRLGRAARDLSRDQSERHRQVSVGTPSPRGWCGEECVCFLQPSAISLRLSCPDIERFGKTESKALILVQLVRGICSRHVRREWRYALNSVQGVVKIQSSRAQAAPRIWQPADRVSSIQSAHKRLPSRAAEPEFSAGELEAEGACEDEVEDSVKIPLVSNRPVLIAPVVSAVKPGTKDNSETVGGSPPNAVGNLLWDDDSVVISALGSTTSVVPLAPLVAIHIHCGVLVVVQSAKLVPASEAEIYVTRKF